jgi:hypothetical protein
VGPRSAPRRRVVERWKTGGYGTTVWHHRLDCGHVERRKRRRPDDEVGCTTCERTAVEVASLPADEVTPVLDVEVQGVLLRARLAAALRLPPDVVTIQLNVNRVAGALILLDPQHIADLLDDVDLT